jgi:hypothetical protein
VLTDHYHRFERVCQLLQLADLGAGEGHIVFRR